MDALKRRYDDANECPYGNEGCEPLKHTRACDDCKKDYRNFWQG